MGVKGVFNFKGVNGGRVKHKNKRLQEIFPLNEDFCGIFSLFLWSGSKIYLFYSLFWQFYRFFEAILRQKPPFSSFLKSANSRTNPNRVLGNLLKQHNTFYFINHSFKSFN